MHVLRLNDIRFLNQFEMVGARLSVSVVDLIVVLFVVFLCSVFSSSLIPLLCFIRMLLFHYDFSTMKCGPNGIKGDVSR